MRKFTRKGYGRIFILDWVKEGVSKIALPNPITIVESIIKEMDAFESDYLPDDLIAFYAEDKAMKYIGKFDDLDLDRLTIECAKKGVFILCVDNGHNEFVERI